MRISDWSSDVCSSDLCGTTGAQDALVKSVQLGAILRRLEPFLARRRRRDRLQPWLDRRILRIEVREVGNEVLHHIHMRKRRHLNAAAPAVLDRGRAGKAVLPADVHRAGTADTFPAGPAAERKR